MQDYGVQHKIPYLTCSFYYAQKYAAEDRKSWKYLDTKRHNIVRKHTKDAVDNILPDLVFAPLPLTFSVSAAPQHLQ